MSAKCHKRTSALQQFMPGSGQILPTQLTLVQPSAAFTRSRVSGSSRMLLPVALPKAFTIAATLAPCEPSPAPSDFSEDCARKAANQSNPHYATIFYVMAQSGHVSRSDGCLLSEVKQTRSGRGVMSASDPKRKSSTIICYYAQARP
jgi:hypothetical protein